MWGGMIATWRMAVEGITEGADILKNGGSAEDAIVKAVSEVEDFLTINQLDTVAYLTKKWKLS